jgi:Membrane bound beta barrel domain (DUF5777)
VTRSSFRLVVILALALAGAPAMAFAQDDDDAVLNLAEQDFTLVTLPTALRVPKYKSAFRVTHRFTRPLGEGDFGDLASDMFGLDNGAQIGLEYRFGIIKNGQIGLHRTSDKTIQFFGQYDLVKQGQLPVDVSAILSIDGTNNFQDSYSPSVGAIVSRRFGTVAALYVEPIWVNNTNPEPKELVDHNDTFMIGIGGRLRVRPTVYIVAEISPRTSGYKPGSSQASFAFEKRAGGHTFQLNFSNALGTTRGQVARGAASNDDWYMGFNISRKFF